MDNVSTDNFNEISRSSLRIIQLRMLMGLADALGRNLSGVKALKDASPSPSEADLSGLWGRLQESTVAVLAEHYPAIVDIGSTNHGCADPVGFADCFTNECLRRSMSSPTDEEDDSFEDAILTEYESGFQESRVELLTDLYTQINLGLETASCEATIRLARSGWAAPKFDPDSVPNKSTLAPEVISPFAAFRFTLPDLGEAPSGVSRNDVVREIHPFLKQAIKDARSYVDRETRNKNSITEENICNRFALLKNATQDEFNKYILDRKLTPHKASLKIMAGRTDLPPDTISRYIRPSKTGVPNRRG